MAEINTSSQNGRHGTRSNKKSTRVDMTPMVDLGFLLINKIDRYAIVDITQKEEGYFQ